MAVFIVTEIYLPLTTSEPNGAGVRTLAVFDNVQEANYYAERHVECLESLTRRDPGHDEFGGMYQGSPVTVDRPGGGKELEVAWQHTTFVNVEKHEAHSPSTSAPALMPLSEVTVGGSLGPIPDIDREEEAGEISPTSGIDKDDEAVEEMSTRLRMARGDQTGREESIGSTPDFYSTKTLTEGSEADRSESADTFSRFGRSNSDEMDTEED